jgi:hypothetical protein
VTPDDKRRRTWLSVGLGCAALVVVALLVGAVVYSRLLGKPPLPPDIQQRYAADTGQVKGPAPPPPVAPAATAGGAKTPPLKQQVEGVAQAVRAGQKGPVTLYVNDSELNREISRALQGRGDVKSAKAYFGDDKVYMVLTSRFRGRDVNLTVTAAPIIVNGGLQFGVESAKIGSMSAPAAVTKKIQEGLNRQQSQWSPQKTGVEFQSVTVTKGQAILKGHTLRTR